MSNFEQNPTMPMTLCGLLLRIAQAMFVPCSSGAMVPKEWWPAYYAVRRAADWYDTVER